jgi:hypothetical protein
VTERWHRQAGNRSVGQHQSAARRNSQFPDLRE